MKIQLYKYCTLSLLFTTLWTLYGFFDYFLRDTKGSLFDGIDTLIYYLYTHIALLVLGILLLIARLFIYLKNKSTGLINNFFCIFAAILNSYMILIWITGTFLGLINYNTEFLIMVLSSAIISSFITYDVIKRNFKSNK